MMRRCRRRGVAHCYATLTHPNPCTYLVLGVLVEEFRVDVEHALQVEGAEAQHLVEVDLGLLRAVDGREGVDGLGVVRIVGEKGEEG